MSHYVTVIEVIGWAITSVLPLRSWKKDGLLMPKCKHWSKENYPKINMVIGQVLTAQTVSKL